MRLACLVSVLLRMAWMCLAMVSVRLWMRVRDLDFILDVMKRCSWLVSASELRNWRTVLLSDSGMRDDTSRVDT